MLQGKLFSSFHFGVLLSKDKFISLEFIVKCLLK